MKELLTWFGCAAAGGALAAGTVLAGTPALVNAGSGHSVDQSSMTLYAGR